VPLKNIHFNALQVELAEEIGESPIHSTPLWTCRLLNFLNKWGAYSCLTPRLHRTCRVPPMVLPRKWTKSLMLSLIRLSLMEVLMRMFLAQVHLTYVLVQMMALTRINLGKKPKVAYTNYSGRYY
jgi:hypothetical protein